MAIKERYEEKMKLLGCKEDPYCYFEKKTTVPVSVEWTSWPDVTYPDIYNYLIVTPGMTHEQLKAYKSLYGFNFYINGKVSSVRVTELPHITTQPKHYLFTALVQHSQTVSAPALRVWVGIKESGEVICAHCTCMAGAGEVCAHVGALLFTAEGNKEMKRCQSCTSLPCSWLPPRHQFVPAIKVTEIDFKTPKSKQLSRLQPDEPEATTNCKESLMTVPGTEQVNKLHVRLSNTVGKPVVLSHTPGFSDAYVPLNMLADFPKPLTELFSKDAIDMSYEDLVETCSEIYDKYVISCDQASLVEENTRQQAKSRIWFQQRAGRITASKLKSAVATDIMKPFVSLIKSICYPDPTVDRFVSAACSYGLYYEDTARKEYVAIMKEMHVDFEVNKTGLIVDPMYPFMGASPDGLVSCTCCGRGVLEVKCPFSSKDKELHSVTNKNSNFFCTLMMMVSLR